MIIWKAGCCPPGLMNWLAAHFKEKKNIKNSIPNLSDTFVTFNDLYTLKECLLATYVTTE